MTTDTGSSALTDDNSAALARLEQKVINVEQQVGDLTRSVDRFVQATEQRFSAQDLEDKLAAKTPPPAAQPAAATSSAGDWIRNNLATIAATAVFGFLTYVNANIQSSVNDVKQVGRDNAAAIVALNTSAAKSFADMAAATAKAFSEAATTTAKEVKDATASAVPRPELEKSIGGNRTEIDRKVDREVFAEAGKMRDGQVLRLQTDVAKIQDDMVKRRDLDTILGAITARQDRTSAQVDDFQRKFIAIPAFPKYNDK